ncbi:MAG: acetamidase/formamidase family protein [Actinomycetota bacterium]
MIHELPLERRSLHGHFSRELEPALTVDSGDSVRIDVPNAGWELDEGGWFEPRDPVLDDGHALAGPIELRGARAGQTLAVRVQAVEPGSRGVTVTPDEQHVLQWQLADGVARCRDFVVPLRPFFGVVGMPPPEPGVHSTVPPRRWGGNIDCKELVAGSVLFLPIPVDGALVSIGDMHGAQGDGEVSGTAIECPGRGQVRLDVRDDLPIDWPVARTDDAWITFGFDPHLDAAARIALDGMIGLLGREHGLEAPDALAIASVVVDLRVTQIVNESVGVHAVLRDGVL